MKIKTAAKAALLMISAAAVFFGTFPAAAQGPGDREYGVYDYGNLLSEEQETQLSGYARDMSARRDINVILVTVTSKDGYSNTDSGSESYAEDVYFEKTGAADAEDASGFLFLIDMENRYLYIYTYDNIHRMLSDSKCEDITDSVVGEAQSQDYMGVMVGVINGIDGGIDSYYRTRTAICWSIRIGGPVLTTGIVLLILLLHKRSKRTTTAATYIDAANCRTVADEDRFTHNTVVVTRTSSGGHGGGGGGGRSGGGGSHF